MIKSAANNCILNYNFVFFPKISFMGSYNTHAFLSRLLFGIATRKRFQDSEINIIACISLFLSIPGNDCSCYRMLFLHKIWNTS